MADPVKADTVQISAPVRVALGYIATNTATYLAAKGIITVDQAGPFAAWLLEATPFIIGIIHTVYTIYKSRKSTRLTDAAATPGVKEIVMATKAEADAIPATNVIGPKG